MIRASIDLARIVDRHHCLFRLFSTPIIGGLVNIRSMNRLIIASPNCKNFAFSYKRNVSVHIHPSQQALFVPQHRGGEIKSVPIEIVVTAKLQLPFFNSEDTIVGEV